MADKRVNELTQIANAPANGVLTIDIPGSTETNGITVDNLFNGYGVVMPFRTINGTQLSIVPQNRFCSIIGGRIEGLMKNDDYQDVWGVYIKLAGISDYKLELFYSLNLDSCHSGYRVGGDETWRRFVIV